MASAIIVLDVCIDCQDNSSMGKRLPHDVIEKLQLAFGARPPVTRADFERAAQACGCGWQAAKAAWARIVEAQLHEERIQQRAELSAGALRAQREEVLARSALEVAHGLMQSAADAVAALDAITSRLKSEVASLPIEQLPGARRQLVAAAKDVIAVGAAALQLERLRVGEASQVVRVEHVDRPLAELEAQVQAAQRALERAKGPATEDDDAEPSDGSGSQQLN
jgi:hypothetical protein